MTLTPKLHKAIEKAALLHKNQDRKGGGTPYISHPYSVGLVLSRYTHDEDVIVAGLLHDILEDVSGYTRKDLERDFGARVTAIVLEVSENKYLTSSCSKKTTWEVVKEGYIEGLRKASDEALMVCAADKIHNLNCKIRDFDEEGNKMWEKFSAPREKQLWFYQEVLSLLKGRLEHAIVHEFELLYTHAHRRFIETH